MSSLFSQYLPAVIDDQFWLSAHAPHKFNNTPAKDTDEDQRACWRNVVKKGKNESEKFNLNIQSLKLYYKLIPSNESGKVKRAYHSPAGENL